MSRGDWATLRRRSRNAGQPWWCSSVRTPFATYPIVMLGLDPSIQGNRSVTRLWTLGSSPRVTIGEWQGCCVFCITTPPHTPLSSRPPLPGRQPWFGVDGVNLHEVYEGRHTSSPASAEPRTEERRG